MHVRSLDKTSGGQHQSNACRDMSKVTGIRYNYDYNVQTIGPDGKVQAVRPPHPVTVKAKIVLKKLIDLLELPANPLDNLIHLCGGRNVVAEMTGRKEMMEMQDDGCFLSVKRAEGVSQQALNLVVRYPPVPPVLYAFAVSSCPLLHLFVFTSTG